MPLIQIAGRKRDIGGMEVRRVLPAPRCKMVGPFIFFDEMGPAVLKPPAMLDVRPHPHIGLSTLTYLFEGVIRHQDSLGEDLEIRPGAVNWMTAGKGIVHSERTPIALRDKPQPLHGLQTWLALPEDQAEIDPGFVHFAAEDIPTFAILDAEVTLVAGIAFDRRSPVPSYSPTCYLDVHLPGGAVFRLPEGHDELAVYPVTGSIEHNGEDVPDGVLSLAEAGDRVVAHSQNARFVVVGGGRFEKTPMIWWNLVAYTEERMEQARQDWESHAFPAVPGDDERIPLPT